MDCLARLNIPPMLISILTDTFEAKRILRSMVLVCLNKRWFVFELFVRASTKNRHIFLCTILRSFLKLWISFKLTLTHFSFSGIVLFLSLSSPDKFLPSPIQERKVAPLSTSCWASLRSKTWPTSSLLRRSRKALTKIKGTECSAP